MIKVGDRIIYNRTKARGVVVDMVIQTPHPILNLPSATMYKIQWDGNQGWRLNSNEISYIREGYLTWEESSNLKLDVKLNREIKLEELGI